MSFRNIQCLAVALAAAFSLAPQSADAQLFGGRGLFGGPGLLPRLGLMPPTYGPGYGGYGGYGGCGECGSGYASTAYIQPNVQTASFGGCGCETATVAQISNPCAVAAAPAPVATACTYVQPVQETVYREVPVTKYRSVQKQGQRTVYKTAYEERDVTVYKTVNEQKTVEVPYTTYQTVQTCQTAQVDRGGWQTQYVRNHKVSPCEYDGRPGFMGWMSRTGYEMRRAFTPDYSKRRQYVPNVQNVAYAVNRQVPVQATRQVTYNVARVVPMTEKRTVAVVKPVTEAYTYTAQVPYTETQTVAVGTTTRYAYVGAQGATATAAAPTPATQSANRPVRPKTANGDATDGRQATKPNPFGQLNSYEPENPPAIHRLQVRRDRDASGWTARGKSDLVLQVAGWRSASDRLATENLSVAAVE